MEQRLQLQILFRSHQFARTEIGKNLPLLVNPKPRNWNILYDIRIYWTFSLITTIPESISQYTNPSYLAVFGTLANSQKPQVWRKIEARKTASLEANSSQKNREFGTASLRGITVVSNESLYYFSIIFIKNMSKMYH